MAPPKDNLSVVLYGKDDLRLEQRPIPEPNDDQVLLRIEVVGICGSDIHLLQDGRLGPFIVEDPIVIGHEASGTVVQCGKNVKNLKPGDQVAIEPGVPCRVCGFCKSGEYHLCDEMVFCACPPDDGALCRYYVHAADFCHKLPPNLDLEDGVLMEPLAVAVHATKKGEVRIGDVVLILGSGPIGLVTLLAVKAMGASKVIITDILDTRLQKAKELGANYTIKIDKDMKEDDVVEKIKELLGEEPNKTFDCTGVESCVRIAVKVTKIQGIVVLVGMGTFEQTLPIQAAIIRELIIRGVFRYNNDYPIAIDMVATGKVSVKPLITHHYKIEDSIEAFETANTQKGNPIKILIHTNPTWKPST